MAEKKSDKTKASKKKTKKVTSKLDSQKKEKDILDLLMDQQNGTDFLGEEPINYEGQLAIDMSETKDSLVVTSTIAGADPEHISINIDGDVLTIRGKRESKTEEKDHNYLYRECFWGWFSRSVVLPVDVKGEAAKAEFDNGVLTITIPKEKRVREVPIHVVDED